MVVPSKGCASGATAMESKSRLAAYSLHFCFEDDHYLSISKMGMNADELRFNIPFLSGMLFKLLRPISVAALSCLQDKR